MKRRRQSSTSRSVYWLLRAMGPVSDNVLESVLWGLHRIPGSTVRGARKRLERSGVVRPEGRTRDGRTKWGLVK